MCGGSFLLPLLSSLRDATCSPFWHCHLPPTGGRLSQGGGFWQCRKLFLLDKGAPLGELPNEVRLKGCPYGCSSTSGSPGL